MFVTAKDDGLIPYVLTQILDACVNGVTLSDPDLPDNPIIYANKAFEAISGYPQEEFEIDKLAGVRKTVSKA